MRSFRLTSALVGMAMLTAACSVSTPRGGWTLPVVESGPQVAQGGEGVDTSGRQAPAASPTVPTAAASSGPVAAGSDTDARTTQNDAPSNQPTGPGAPAEDPSGQAPADTTGDPNPAAPSDEQEPLRASEVGVTEDTITFSVSGTFSGPYGPLIDNIVTNGFGVWTDDVNDRGGIHGRQVVWKKVDDKGTSDGAVAACKEIQSNGTMFAFAIGNTEGPQSVCLDEAGIPMIVQFQSALDEDWSWIKGMTYGPTTGRSLPSFLRSRLEGELKAGIIYVNQPLFSSGADGFREAAPQQGIEVVAEQAIQEGQTSFVAELARIRDAGANVVVLYVFSEIIGIMRDASAIGYEPHFTGTGFHIDEFTQGARDLMSGVTALRPFATVDSPRYEKFQQKANEYGYANPSTSVMAVYGAGLMLERILAEAGRNPTRESMRDGFGMIRDFDTQIWPPFSWPGGRVLGSDAWFPVVCCNDNGTWSALGPPASEF